MKIAVDRSALAAAALSVFLSACGGGGGSSPASPSAAASGPAPASGSAPATGASSAAAISLLAPAGPSATPFIATGDPVADSAGYLNDKRAQLGLPVIALQASVAQAATDHSIYLQNNNTIGHYETAGLPGYTGVTPTDRVNALYPTTSAGEIVAGVTGTFTSSVEAIDLLFDAPFHRAITLFDITRAGPGVAVSATPAKLSVLTVDFVDYKQFVPDNKLIAYPYPGQTDTKSSWADNESPDPLASAPQSYAGKTVGYPVTLSGAGSAAFSNVAFSITDASGASVPCQESDSSNNTEATRLALCVPFAPLAASATYWVHVTGSLTNTSIPTPQAFDVSWSFATAAATPAVSKAAIGVPARKIIIH